MESGYQRSSQASTPPKPILIPGFSIDAPRDKNEERIIKEGIDTQKTSAQIQNELEVYRSGGTAKGIDWRIPEAAVDKIPSAWGPGRDNKKVGTGMRWQDPKDRGNNVRIDRGNPNSSLPSQQVDHVVISSKGMTIGRDGRPISGSIKQDPVNAHIPLSEWLEWKSWNRP